MCFMCINLFNSCKNHLHFTVKKRALKDVVDSQVVQGENRTELNSSSITLEPKYLTSTLFQFLKYMIAEMLL